MRDRVSTKILDNGATRYGVYDETGKLLRYEYIKLEDEPSTEGDFFNKANMLPDSITAMLGLKMENPQVKDALNVLANVGNLHVWERVQTYKDEVPATYKYGDEETINVYGPYAYGGDISTATLTNISWTYGDITVENGYVELINSTTDKVATNAYGALPAEFAGRYIKRNSTIYYCPDTAYMNTYSSGGYWTDICGIRPVKYVPSIPAGTTTDYLTSTDRNAYPDKSAAGGQDAYYSLGDVVIGSLSLYEHTTSRNYVNWDIASDLSISDDGTVSLVSPTSVSISPTSYTNANSMLGKYIQLKDDAYAMYTTITPGSVFYIPSDAGVSSGSPGGVNKVWLTKYQPVTGHAAIPANTTITYLGQLGGGARIEVGSYVGTGTYGSGNKNTLTFKNKRPKKVTVVPKTHSDNSQIVSGSFPFVNGAESAVARLYLGSYSSKNVNLSWSDDSVSWYSTDSADVQLNKNSETYFYVAEF